MSEKKYIARLSDHCKDGIYDININNESLLLIRHQRKYYLIKNKCGHFGVPLNNAHLSDNTIICRQHGISFDLESGFIVNRPYENCDALQVYPLFVEQACLYAML